MDVLEEHTEKTILPFAFEGLKKISRRHLEIEAGLFNFLPITSSDNVFKKVLEEFLSKQFNLNAKIQLERFEEGDLGEFIKGLPDPCLVSVLGLQPVSAKAFLWIDSVLAMTLIDRVLGGVGEIPTELRSLSPIEEGVFQYLLLKSLSEIFQAAQESASVHFRLEQVAKSQKELKVHGQEDVPVVLLHFRVQVGSCVGFTVLAFPHPLVEGAFLSRGPLENPDRLQEYEYSLNRFEQMGHIRSQFWAEIGSVSLTLSEKNQLEKGDVILFDQTQCQMACGDLTGNVVLRVGEGKGGGFLAQVVSGEAPAIIKVLDYYGGE